MQVLRLNEVSMRVVAWHNRHPLARRINASQVHSIGEVLLPFAASEPVSVPPWPGVAASLPAVADLLDPPQTLTTLLPDALGQAAPALAAPLGAVPDATAPAASPEDSDLSPSLTAEARPAAIPDVDIDVDTSPFTLAEADLAVQLAAELDATTRAQADAANPLPPLDLPLPLAPQAGSGRSAALLLSLNAAVPATSVSAPPSRLQRLRAWLTGRQTGMPRLQATFSRDFLSPLSPRRVARWARGHGQLQPLAPADWPRRVVETDGKLLDAARQKGLSHAVELHLLTAAIGVGDRRLRLLMDAQGAVIGPRAYSRPRLAAAAGLLALALFGLGWTTLRPRLADESALLAAAASTGAAAASATAAAASVPETVPAPVIDSAAAAAASASTVTAAASTPATAASPAGHADVNAAAIASAHEAATPPAVAQHAGPAAVIAPAAGPATPLATSPPQIATAASTSEGAANNAGPLGHIRPSLSDEDKQAARTQATALRDAKAAAPQAAAAASAPNTVYAVVSRPSPQREVALAGLSVMHRASGRLPPPVPEHGELMQSQGAWRAVWWPFASLADAERARVLLAGKGLKVEVVEF